jgi:hypothetical protein
MTQRVKTNKQQQQQQQQQQQAKGKEGRNGAMCIVGEKMALDKLIESQ